MKTVSRTIPQFALILTGAALLVLIINNARYGRLLERLETDNTQLVRQLEESRSMPAAAVELLSWDIQAMKKKGLHDPINEIIADLKQHRELIPYKGVLGGTMNFYDDSKIWVLTKKWVLAYFEDGHVAGYLLLEYEVTQGGKIRWKTVASSIA
jgi:hypothetical protein